MESVHHKIAIGPYALVCFVVGLVCYPIEAVYHWVLFGQSLTPWQLGVETFFTYHLPMGAGGLFVGIVFLRHQPAEECYRALYVPVLLFGCVVAMIVGMTLQYIFPIHAIAAVSHDALVQSLIRGCLDVFQAWIVVTLGFEVLFHPRILAIVWHTAGEEPAHSTPSPSKSTDS